MGKYWLQKKGELEAASGKYCQVGEKREHVLEVATHCLCSAKY
jgi:hypothetical protein